MSQKLKELELLYNNTDIGKNFQLIVDKNDLADSKDKNIIIKDTSENDATIIPCSGKNVELIWSKAEGIIEYGEDEIKVLLF